MSEIQAALRAGPQGFPFRSELSLAPLIAFWTKTSADGPPGKAALARIVAEQLEKATELLEPIHDVAILEKCPRFTVRQPDGRGAVLRHLQQTTLAALVSA